MSTDGVSGSRSAVTSYLDIVFYRALNNSAEFLSNDPLSASFGWDLHKNGMLHVGRLNSPITSFFHGSSNQALWNLHIVASLDTEWEISQEFLLPSTQLITKCKRRVKLNGKIKRSKRSHLYYSNSIVTDRLVLAGDVETNPGPNAAKTGRKKSVQNSAVRKSCLACNKTIRLNQKELTCNLCSGSFHYKCEAGKLKLDVNLWNCTRCGLPPLSDSFFDLDTKLNRSRRSSQYDDIEDNDSDSLDWYQSNISGYYKFNIKIGYLNINSVVNKIDEVKDLLNRNMFDILFLAETKIDSTVSSHLVSHPGFRTIRKDRKKGAGGLLAYIRNDLSAYRRLKLESSNIESICLDVKGSNNSRFIVCGCYRSPTKCKESDFLASLSTAAENMYNTRRELLLLGDFNMDMYENRDEGRFPDTRLVDFCNRFCLSNRIDNPTRVTKTSKSLIDVLLTSHAERYATSGSLHLGLSDHDLIFTVRKNKNSRPQPRLIEFRSMKNFKLPDFLADLKRVPWSSAYTFDNADDVWAHWRALFKDVLDQHVPLKKKWIRGDQLPWISPDLLREISHRNKLFKRHKRNPTSTSWDDYKRQRNKVTSLKRNAVKRFCCDTSLSAKHPGEFWRKMKPLLPTSSGKNIQGVILVEDSGVVSDPGRVAEVFSDYFANIIQLGHRSDTDYTDHPRLDGVCSDFKTVESGVPQGSLLGPLLFNIFINDLNFCVPNVSLRLYADDTTAYLSDVSPTILEFSFNKDLQALSTWFESNYLTVNCAKTQALSVGPCAYHCSLFLNNAQIEFLRSIKILGVTLDKDLSYKEHISDQLKKAYAKASALRRIRRFLPHDAMIKLYKAFILPHLEYCGPLFVGIGTGQRNRLEDGNCYILRTLIGHNKSMSYDELLTAASMTSLYCRRLHQALILLFKCLNGTGPTYIASLFKYRHTPYRLRGEGLNLELPKFNCKFKKNSVTYSLTKLWNSLPSHVRLSSDSSDFKSKLQDRSFLERVL